MEDFSDEFTSMPDAPATNGSFGQRMRNFLWDNKNSIFLTGCFVSVLAALVVYMMKQRQVRILEVNECTELKKAVKEHIELMIRQTDYVTKRWRVRRGTFDAYQKKLELSLRKLKSLTRK